MVMNSRYALVVRSKAVLCIWERPSRSHRRPPQGGARNVRASRWALRHRIVFVKPGHRKLLLVGLPARPSTIDRVGAARNCHLRQVPPCMDAVVLPRAIVLPHGAYDVFTISCIRDEKVPSILRGLDAQCVIPQRSTDRGHGGTVHLVEREHPLSEIRGVITLRRARPLGESMAGTRAEEDYFGGNPIAPTSGETREIRK